MRGKQKAAEAIGKPPAHLTVDGMNAWHHQQREREMELRRRRQEAEQLLRGYRMTMVPDNLNTKTSRRDSYGYSTVRGQLFEKDMNTIPSESIENIEFDNGGIERQIGRLSIQERPYHLTGQSRNEEEVGRLGIDERAWKPSDPFDSSNDREVGRLGVNVSGSEESDSFGGAHNKDSESFILETPSNEEKKSEGEYLSGSDQEMGEPRSSREGKKVPTPARALLPDETDWRDFISSGEY